MLTFGKNGWWRQWCFFTVGNHEEAVMTIEQRLECLERRVKRYRNALVLLVMIVCSVALIGATTDDGIIRGKGMDRQSDRSWEKMGER